MLVSLQRMWHPLFWIRMPITAGGVRIFTQSNRQRNDQRYSGIGQFVNYQTCTGLRQHGCRLLPEPETVDPGHRSMLCKDSNPLDSEVKDAYSVPFNQGRNIENNDSCLMEKHEFLQSIESTIQHFPELQPEDL